MVTDIGADEHYYIHMMRNHSDFIPELAFVLEKDGEIIGNIMYTKAWLEGENGAPKEKKWMPSQEEFYIYSHSSVVR